MAASIAEDLFTALGFVIGIFIVVPLVVPVVCLGSCLKSCLKSMKAPSADPIADSNPVPNEANPVPNELEANPVPNEASAPTVINPQSEPSNEGINAPSDEGAVSVSTMPGLPTTPMRIYVRVFTPLFRSCSFILFLGPLGSERSIHVSRAPRRSVYEGRLFPDNFWTVPRYRKSPHAGKHASLVTHVATRTQWHAHISRASIRSVFQGRSSRQFRTVPRYRKHPQTDQHASISGTRTYQ